MRYGRHVMPSSVRSAQGLLFYGASMLIAAVRRSGGREVTTILNALVRRDDQWGCALFAPVDLAKRSRLIRGRPR